MPEIRVAEQAGACYGVERALDMVGQAVEQSSSPVHTLGPLIHNPQVVRSLEARGVTVVNDVCQEPGSVLVIRSHGVVPGVITQAEARGLEVVDATCPYVKKVHHAAEKLARDGYQVVVVGEKGHPEVEGILGHAPGSIVVGSAEEARALDLHGRVGVVVQTTQSRDLLERVCAALVGGVEELRVVNTICAATSERQAAAAALASRASVMVVIGGRNSGNTRRLASICSERCPRTHHIESPQELEAPWFEGASLVGITAGASTPGSQIEAVRSAIEHLCGAADGESRA